MLQLLIKYRGVYGLLLLEGFKQECFCLEMTWRTLTCVRVQGICSFSPLPLLSLPLLTRLLTWKSPQPLSLNRLFLQPITPFVSIRADPGLSCSCSFLTPLLLYLESPPSLSSILSKLPRHLENAALCMNEALPVHTTGSVLCPWGPTFLCSLPCPSVVPVTRFGLYIAHLSFSRRAHKFLEAGIHACLVLCLSSLINNMLSD